MKSLSRKIIKIGVAIAAAVSLGACSITTGTPGANPTGEREIKDEYRVAYIARAQADSFAAWLANEMKSAADEYDNITVEVFDGQADDEIENKMIENAIVNNFDAVIIQPNNADAQLPYIQRAVDAGIVTITTNPRVEGIEGADSVDASPYEQGAVVAKHALDLVPDGGKVVVLTGPPGNFHSTARRDAWEKEFFEKREDVTIVAEDIANWNKAEALNLMEDWSLANPQIDAIVSMNDNMAAGALEAVKGKSGFSEIMSFGVDGTPEAVLLIEEGAMTATSLQNARELAQLNIKAAHDLLTGSRDEVDDDISNPLITQENAQEYIDLYKETGLINE